MIPYKIEIYVLPDEEQIKITLVSWLPNHRPWISYLTQAEYDLSVSKYNPKLSNIWKDVSIPNHLNKQTSCKHGIQHYI